MELTLMNSGWQKVIGCELEQPYYQELSRYIEEEEKKYKIYPNPEDRLNAFHFTEFNKVKVVILGQDPYHNEGQSHGLCFSVKPGVAIPPSLVNIYKELRSDLGYEIPKHGYLEQWARQGVLLLNTVLTVRAHEANSHYGKGWEKFTDAVIEALNQQDRPIVFILWGKPAQKKKKMLTNPNHLRIEGPHPSPLSAYRGFFGSKPFSQVNEFLKAHGGDPVDWSLDEVSDVDLK